MLKRDAARGGRGGGKIGHGPANVRGSIWRLLGAKEERFCDFVLM